MFKSQTNLMKKTINPNHGNQPGRLEFGNPIDENFGRGKTGLVDNPGDCFLQNVI